MSPHQSLESQALPRRSCDRSKARLEAGELDGMSRRREVGACPMRRMRLLPYKSGCASRDATTFRDRRLARRRHTRRNPRAGDRSPSPELLGRVRREGRPARQRDSRGRVGRRDRRVSAADGDRRLEPDGDDARADRRRSRQLQAAKGSALARRSYRRRWIARGSLAVASCS